MLEISDLFTYKSTDLLEECKEITNITTDIPYVEFFNNYLLLNKPCIIKNVTKDWLASKKWIKNDKLNLNYLLENYGSLEGCVSDCNERYYNAQRTTTLPFTEYVKYFEKFINDGRQTPLLYLKDWHLRRNCLEVFYKTPVYFGSDWLNEYFSECTEDDYMFVYMGPEGTWTPFHVDVFTSYSWSTNVCGKKKWYLFPPGSETSLKDPLGNLPYDVTKTNCDAYLEVIQNAGDAIFVPSGWHHQVWNLADTISINHNWVNGCNVMKMWESIAENLKAVKKEIEDCKDMENWLGQCQIMLKVSHGMNFEMFYDFLCHVAVKRIKILKGEVCDVIDFYRLGRNHCRFDLSKVREVLMAFMKHEDFLEFCFICNDLKPEDLLNAVENML